MTKEQEKAIEHLEELSNYCALKNIDREDNTFGEFVIDIQKIKNLIQTQQEEINFLIQERNYIKSNLEVDLNRRNIYSQAKGQISQILEYYTSNDRQLNNILKGR